MSTPGRSPTSPLGKFVPFAEVDVAMVGAPVRSPTKSAYEDSADLVTAEVVRTAIEILNSHNRTYIASIE